MAVHPRVAAHLFSKVNKLPLKKEHLACSLQTRIYTEAQIKKKHFYRLFTSIHVLFWMHHAEHCRAVSVE